MNRVRPTRPLAPIAASVLILGLWWLVAHNGGAGWVQVLGDLVFGALFIGILGPSLVLGRASVRVSAAPVDGVAGLPLVLQLEASSRLRVRPSEPPGDEAFVGPGTRRQPARGRVTLHPPRRGLFDAVTLDIASAAPFGLQWWTRRVRLTMPAPLHVAPRRGRPQTPSLWLSEDTGGFVDRAHVDLGQPRGARPYRWGDNRRLVHWRATAHAGELMVRELERPSAAPMTVTVVLPLDPDEAERIAERALGTVVLLLDRGTPVLLATTEPSGSVVAPVLDRRGAGRRLARAVASPGALGSSGGIAVS